MRNKDNIIELKMQCMADNVKILRLAAAGAANATGFDIDLIEDVKVVVSEVFNCVVNSGAKEFKVLFYIDASELKLHFETCCDKKILDGANDMTIPILEALVSEVNIGKKGEVSIIIK